MGPGKIGSDLLAEVGDQDQHEQVHEVAHAPHDELYDLYDFGWVTMLIRYRAPAILASYSHSTRLN